MGCLRFPNPTLCFFQFLLYCFASHCFSLVPLCNHDQSSALLHFKNSFHLKSSASYYQPSHPKTASWENGTNCCLWDGVTCDTISGHVIALDLSSSWLLGKVHPNSTLFQLIHLQRLSLADNNFLESPILSEFGELVSLTHLNLSFAKFSGEITSKISHLSKLISIDFSKNDNLRLEPSTWNKLIQNVTDLRELFLEQVNMSSIRPTSLSLLTNLSSSLESLHLSSAELQGNLEDDILFLPNLRYIDLSENPNIKVQVSNTNWSTSLVHLNVNHIVFLGEVFDSISNLKSLNFLGLDYCIFQESNIHVSFWNLTQLTYLSLLSNNFSGEISSLLSNLQHLTYLDLSDNHFSGQIPDIFSHLEQLETLYISGNNLGGQLPPSLFGLTQLSSLDCSNNKLGGPIDFHQFSKLQNLEFLDLSNNKFLSINFNNEVDYVVPNLQFLYLSSCNIYYFPNFLAKLQDLKTLNLSNNHIHGMIPNLFNDMENGSLSILDLSHNFFTSVEHLPWTKIIYIDLSSNMLTGDIFSGFCNASSLNILNLSHNNLTGMIPPCIGILPSLSVLNLEMNNLHGTIPGNFSKNSVLESIKLSENHLEGPLPRSLANSQQLEILDLANNNIEDTFPNWLDDLQKLQVLILRANKFHGTISHSKSRHPFPQLRIFDVSNNYFSGPLPTKYIKNFKGMINVNDGATGLQYMRNTNFSYYHSVVVTIKGSYTEMERILSAFTTIDLSKNRFEGDIPTGIGKLYSLKGLNLSHNRIIGAIPISIGNLTNLEWLDLSSNMLTGNIPLSLTNLNFLSFLNLSQNQLMGMIPRGKQFNTFPNDSYEGNQGLCGFPLSKICNNADEAKVPPSSTFHNDEESTFGWKAVAVGYGCGMVFGVFMGYIVFSTGKPRWLLKFVEGRYTKRVK